MKTLKYILLLSFVAVMFSACSDSFLNTEPTSSITTDRLQNPAVDKEQVLISQVGGLYSWLMQYNTMNLNTVRHTDFGVYNIFITTDLMNTDMLMNTSNYGWYYNCYDFSDRPSYEYTDNFMYWNFCYRLIYNANRIIELFSEEEADLDLLRLKGQALAMRAYAYYYLVQLYQHTYVGHQNEPAVPLVLETSTMDELRSNPRATVEVIYEQMEKDLLAAYDNIEGYTRTDKNQLNQQVVAGLLARVYLNMENGTEAVKYAKLARAGYTPSITQWDYTNRTLGGFMNYAEPDWMWAIITTAQSRIVTSGIVNPISHLGSMSYGYTTAGQMQKMIDVKLLNSIPTSDIRGNAFARTATNALGYPIPLHSNLKFGPYQVGSDENQNDYPLMRASEMYLIEAEGHMLSGNNTEAQNVLYEFAITRDPAYTKSTSTGAALRAEIYWQRRVELWGEGFSYFDHKRLKLPIERTYAGTNHRGDALFDHPAEGDVFRFRIPRQEMINNPGIESNNP